MGCCAKKRKIKKSHHSRKGGSKAGGSGKSGSSVGRQLSNRGGSAQGGRAPRKASNSNRGGHPPPPKGLAPRKTSSKSKSRSSAEPKKKHSSRGSSKASAKNSSSAASKQRSAEPVASHGKHGPLPKSPKDASQRGGSKRAGKDKPEKATKPGKDKPNKEPGSESSQSQRSGRKVKSEKPQKRIPPPGHTTDTSLIPELPDSERNAKPPQPPGVSPAKSPIGKICPKESTKSRSIDEKKPPFVFEGIADPKHPQQQLIITSFVTKGRRVKRWSYADSYPVGEKPPSFGSYLLKPPNCPRTDCPLTSTPTSKIEKNGTTYLSLKSSDTTTPCGGSAPCGGASGGSKRPSAESLIRLLADSQQKLDDACAKIDSMRKKEKDESLYADTMVHARGVGKELDRLSRVLRAESSKK